MTSQPLISVIVPVYNVERYLDQCLESIVGQSYPHLEILVVDDGSTDASGDKCDRWAERDDRISVIHQPNGGLSAARNTALDAMTGEWVIMVDSDDIMHRDAAAVLLDTIQRQQADMVIGDYIPVYDNAAPQWPVDSSQPAQCQSTRHCWPSSTSEDSPTRHGQESTAHRFLTTSATLSGSSMRTSPSSILY